MSFLKTLSSVLPSTAPPPGLSPLTDENPSMTVVPAEESRQPRKSKRVKLQPDDGAQALSDVDHNESESTDVAAISSQNELASGASQTMVQGADRVQGFEQSSVSEDRGPDQLVFSTPETNHYNLESDADAEAVDSEINETTQTSNSITTTTTTKVEERKRTAVQIADQSVAESAATERRFAVWSSTQGGVQRKASFYRETSVAPISDVGPPHFSSVSTVVETRRSMAQSGAMYNSVQDELKRLKNLYIEQTNCTETILTNQHKEYERYSEAGIAALQEENENLRKRIAMLEVQLSSVRGRQTSLALPPAVDSTITTITTNITIITTTITTITTRIEQWKRTRPRNDRVITISSQELDQLSLDLSNTSSRLDELHQHYTQQSSDIISVRNELQLSRTLCEEKDLKVASLTAEVTQLKNSDTMKTDQISSSSTRITTLEQRFDAQSGELASLRSELQVKLSLIDEKSRTVASITAEVTQLKKSDSVKADEIAIARRTIEQLQRDLSAVTSQRGELQMRYDTQSKDLGSLRGELQVKGSLLEERDRTITTLGVELDQWKLTEARMEEQFAAARRDNEKLQRDLKAFSTQTADLRKRYDSQSRDLVSIQTEFQTKVSQLDEKEHIVTSLTAEVAQWKREDAVKAEQLEVAHRDVEQLRRDLSTATSRTSELQKRFEAQSKELTNALDELRQVEILYSGSGGNASGKPSQSAVAKQIKTALETKNKQMDELRRDLDAATSQNAVLQKQYEVVSGEISIIRNELTVKTSQHEGIATSLNAEADKWKRADSMKAEQIATTLKQVEKLQRDLSTSTSQLTDLQKRYEAQSRDLTTVRTDLQDKISSHEGKDRTIASLTAEVDQWKLADGKKGEQIMEINKTVDTLQRNLSTSASQLADFKGRHESQLHDLKALRDELEAKMLSQDGKDRTIASLTAEVDHWKHADSAKAAQIVDTVKQVEKLREDISTSSSRIVELQGRYEAQSRELVSVRTEIQTKIAVQEERDRTISSLTAEVDRWKREDATKAEQIATTLGRVEMLQRDLASSTSRITELQDRYDAQSRELQTKTSLLQESRDRKVAALTTQVEEWKRSDALKAEQIVTIRVQLENFQRELTTTTSQLTDLQERYETQSRERDSLRAQLETNSSAQESTVAMLTSQVEEWKHSHTAKAEELVIAYKEVEQLRRNITISSSQIVELQQRYETQHQELTSQVEKWQRSDATHAEDLATTRKELDRLQRDLLTASSRVLEFQQRCDAQSTEVNSLRDQLQTKLSVEGGKDRIVVALNAQIDQWKREDATKASQLVAARQDVEKLQHNLSAASLRIAELEHSQKTLISEESQKFSEQLTTQYEVRDNAAILKLTATVDEWLNSDARRAEQIAVELEKRKTENEELRQKLVILKEIYVRAPELKQIFQSQTIEIQRRFEEQSKELKLALAERQSQLDGVQRFITTADTYADTAIIQMLQKLNAEVQHSTTFMAERMIEDFRPQAATTKQQAAILQKVSQSIGQTLVDCLVRKDVEEVALYLAIAFQAYLSYQLRWIVSSWTIENGRNELINEIYQRLQKSEAQAISGRWRSLTRNYILPTCVSDPKTLISSIIAGLSDIVMVAGCATSQNAAKTKLATNFEGKLSSIISIAGQFSKMVGEVVSGDFEVFATRPSETFEEETMEEDTDDDDGHVTRPSGMATGQKVLCSTHLGMTKRMQLESGKKQTLTVIKGKVILESFLGN